MSVAVIITVSSWVVRWDERRLQRAADNGDARAEARLERAWPAPSRDNALIGLALLAAPLLGLFAVWFHFFRTRSRSLLRPWRWSPTGFGLGVLAVAVVMLANAVVVLGLAYLLGVSVD